MSFTSCDKPSTGPGARDDASVLAGAFDTAAADVVDVWAVARESWALTLCTSTAQSTVNDARKIARWEGDPKPGSMDDVIAISSYGWVFVCANMHQHSPNSTWIGRQIAARNWPASQERWPFPGLERYLQSCFPRFQPVPLTRPVEEPSSARSASPLAGRRCQIAIFRDR
jgi:hypothetical protein